MNCDSCSYTLVHHMRVTVVCNEKKDKLNSIQPFLQSNQTDIVSPTVIDFSDLV